MNAEALYTKVKVLLDANSAKDPGAWVDVVAALMRAVRQWRRPGADKKTMVLSVLDLIIERDVPNGHKGAARAAVDGLSHGIDLAVRYQGLKWWSRITSCCK